MSITNQRRAGTTLAVALCLAVPILPSAALGGSTPISTPADLNLIRADLAGSFHLINDIDLTGVLFAPIGDPGDPFTGSLNGAGYTISNLTINECPEIEDYLDFLEEDHIAFFGATDGASIYDLNLADVSIAGDEFVGALIAQAGDTRLRQCSATGSVWGRIQVGGMVGFFGNSGPDSSLTETNLSWAGTSSPSGTSSRTSRIRSSGSTAVPADANAEGPRAVAVSLGFVLDQRAPQLVSNAWVGYDDSSTGEGPSDSSWAIRVTISSICWTIVTSHSLSQQFDQCCLSTDGVECARCVVKREELLA